LRACHRRVCRFDATARRRNYPWRRESIPRAEACLRLRESIVAVMMPLIIIGGIEPAPRWHGNPRP
jgi:TRAP-type C4-dicarboxylate transport system permease large subunit